MGKSGRAALVHGSQEAGKIVANIRAKHVIRGGPGIDCGGGESTKSALVVIENAQSQPVFPPVAETTLCSEVRNGRDVAVSVFVHVSLVGHGSRQEEAFPEVILSFQLESLKRGLA